MSEERIRVVAPDVGGGFGSKLQIYGEEILLRPRASSAAGQVDRDALREHGAPTTAATRSPRQDRREADGTITAFHARIVADIGAYPMLLTPTIPSLGAFVMSGCYSPRRPHGHHRRLHEQVATDAIRGPAGPRRRT